MPKKPRGRPGPYLLHLDILPERIPDATKFPYSLPVIRNFSRLSFHPQVTFLIGENGSGKSTLLEAMAVAYGFNAEGGSRNFNFSTYASHSRLDEAVRLVKSASTPATSYFLRAESYYNLATEIEDRGVLQYYGGVSLHEQSHGESYFALFENRLLKNGLYLMDEPEAALSPMRQLQFVVLLHDYVELGCQFVIATHSPILMAYPDAQIYLLGDGIREVRYRDTEHYQVTRGFLEDTQCSLAELFASDAPE